MKDLGVALQQMTEIAKALSRNADIIVMDEPTSALTDQEIPQLFEAIRRLKAQNKSVIYISHRLEELYEIGDVATVLRDGTYVGTVPVAELSMDKLITMMVGRELKEKFPKDEVTIGEEVLRVENLNRDGVLQDISFNLRKGEILGISGLVGSGRTELARAIFGADPITSGSIYLEGKKVRINSPIDAIKHGIGFLTEDRKGQGLILIQSVQNNITLAFLRNFSPNTSSNARARRRPPRSSSPAWDQDAQPAATGAISEWREPTESRRGQMVVWKLEKYSSSMNPREVSM